MKEFRNTNEITKEDLKKMYNAIVKFDNYISSIINELARKDKFTNDKQYNSGLRLIREMGYRYVSGEPDVKYYCMCNGY